MSKKMDRQGSKTPADLEYRYLFGKTFAEIMGVATDARNIAVEAKTSYEGLNQEEIFNRLTNNGEWEGLYEAEGKVYINASYIKSGSLDVSLLKTGKIKSSNYNETTDGVPLLGMSIDLDNGIINSPKFKLNSSGEITTTAGYIAGFDISEEGLTTSSSYTSISGDIYQQILISPSEITASATHEDGWSSSARLTRGIIEVEATHDKGWFDGIFLKYIENDAIYFLYIDPETMTVKVDQA